MHTIAFDLGYTVRELGEQLTYREFQDWCTWYELRNAETEKPSGGDVIDLDKTRREDVPHG